jgi:hypothetical protein
MTQWIAVKVSKDETLFINTANIVKISGGLGQTTLHYVNGERELLSGQQSAGILEWSRAHCWGRRGEGRSDETAKRTAVQLPLKAR